jgi:uncharacterized RDD family membrane protein YckC
VRSAESALPVGFIEPTFGQRLAGRFIDGLLVFGALRLAETVVDDVAFGFLALAGWLAYELGTTLAWDGQTVGKRWVGTRVRALSGDNPTAKALVVRALVLLVCLPLWVLTALPILKGPLHRGLHDRVAGTIVTSLEDRTPGAVC